MRRTKNRRRMGARRDLRLARARAIIGKRRRQIKRFGRRRRLACCCDVDVVVARVNQVFVARRRRLDCGCACVLCMYVLCVRVLCDLLCRSAFSLCFLSLSSLL
jgi:hypothetical protein